MLGINLIWITYFIIIARHVIIFISNILRHGRLIDWVNILFHLMPLPHFHETGCLNVLLISKEIDSKSLMRFGQGSNPQPPTPKANTLAQSQWHDRNEKYIIY